ncbi:hypothetical protein MIR68_009841 [Amoeboaphelidium protococcarum]|nr:hypothetical protein MIR68_009841 [Amoeboaphelidium protococcarum]
MSKKGVKYDDDKSSEQDFLIQTKVNLYLYNPTNQMFVLQTSDAFIEIEKTGQFEYVLSVSDSKTDNVYMSQPIDSSMNSVFNKEHGSFIWVYHDEVKKVSYSWSVKFLENGGYTEFQEVFGPCLYESMNRDSFKKVTIGDKQYLTRGYAIEDVEMTDGFETASEHRGDDSDDEQSRYDDDGDDRRHAAADSSDQSESEDEEEQPQRRIRGGKTSLSYNADLPEEYLSQTQKNTNLTMSYVNNRSFVTRGNIIGVFKNDVDNVQYATTINNVKRPSDKKSFSPSKVMLHNQDSSLVLMDRDRPNELYRMDLEAGKIVDEWKVNDSIQVKDFTNLTKYGQTDTEQRFVGVSHNALFNIDPRQPDAMILDNEMKQYKSKNEFSCVATTGKGDLVVASDKGDIRLYNDVAKRAKTLLPGFGDNIIGVDVSEDGEYILATCKTYLLLIPAKVSTDNGLVDGFSKSLGSNKPTPKRLQLRPEHIAYMNSQISFTPAKFNTEPGSKEKSIVTSTGPYVITWNFRQVKNGKLNSYSINKYPGRVVADRFMHKSDKHVIVALEDDVTVASKKDFKSPAKMFTTKKA